MMMANKKTMKKSFDIKFLLIILFVFSLSAFAQSNATIEKELVAALKEVQKYSVYGSNNNDEKLTKANDAFDEKLLKYTKTPSTLQYKFPALEKLMYMATSE